MSAIPDLEEFRARARAWLRDNAEPRRATDPDEFVWGQGSDSVALFQNLSHDQERAIIEAGLEWQRRKTAAGFGSITWPEEYGGAGLPAAYERAFRTEESAFDTPPTVEAHGITWELIGNTIRTVGSDEQKRTYLPPLRGGEVLWCQLFSEPAAGSDLAGVATRAERVADGWVLNGQKVWTSGAQFASMGYIVCRTDVEAPKHKGLTTFILPMDAPGVDVRPLRQATGGSSFNEVFLTDVHIGDELRLGEVNDGWGVVLTTLGFERLTAGAGGGSAGGTDRRFHMLLETARRTGRSHEPLVRQRLAEVYVRQLALRLTNTRARVNAAGGVPGPEASLGKLGWTENLRLMGDVAGELIGPAMAADTGRWGTFAWTQHLLGTAGYRIAAGTDEVQRNIIGEMVLGLPREPRVDKGIAFKDIPRPGRG